MYDLQEIEAIKRLKYRYLRCLDCKLWDELKQCFIPEATAAYSGGKYSFETRDEIVARIEGLVRLEAPGTWRSNSPARPRLRGCGPSRTA